jgi:uncharacterized damage-inducible protein DinB
MTKIAFIRQLSLHGAWADDQLLRVLTDAVEVPEQAWREFAHVLGAEEVWLARMEQRAPSLPVWPTISPQQCAALKDRLAGGYSALLASLSDADLDRDVTYATSDGRAFTNSIGDILAHVAMHGQYHRGKMNLLLRQGGITPAPVDVIAFIRGAPSATQASAAAREQSTNG